MKKLVINKTILIFLNINEMISLKYGDLKKIKEKYLTEFDNCIIYDYYQLKNKKNIIKDKINKLKFNKQIKINARKCNIKEIDNKLKNEFLNKYHIQGTDKSQIYYGGFYNNELIAVMSFSNKRGINGGLNINEYELSRFSVKSNLIVVGIFNRILKSFINTYKPNSIISFADLNYTNKEYNIYINNNFKTLKINQPDYNYYDKVSGKIYHKFTFGTKYLKESSQSMTCKKNKINNLFKVWNCGKIKYQLFLTPQGNPIIGFIYMIKNKINNKKYIGQTTRTLTKRIYEYKSAYNNNRYYNQYLLNAFNKYGWDNFEFSVIDTAQSIDELNNKEIKYILDYKSNNKEFGYNIESGGCNAIPDIDTLNKMSKSHLGVKQTDNWIKKRIAIAGSDEAKKYGRKKSIQEKLELSKKSPKYWLGKNRDETTKEKISRTKKENGLSKKQKEVICKKVYKINSHNNKIIEVFESTSHASKIIGVNQSTISRWCKYNKIIDDYFWTYND